jgi:hypothetical protein
VDAIYLDQAKAFDKVNVPLFIHKLRIMGFNEQILDWIAEYFNERKQLVKLNANTISNPINVTSGVGQGSPISATLFSLLLYDLPLILNYASISLYADDAKIFLPINTINDCNILQNELNIAKMYFENNCLKLNEKKTKQITFHKKNSPIDFVYLLNGSTIEKEKTIRELGILLDEKFTFKDHIDYTVSKAKSVLTWVKRFSYEFDDPWVIKRLFETFVIPIIEYGSQIWSPKFKNDIKKIESIQKQFLIFALRKFRWYKENDFSLPSYKHRLLFFHMNTLEDRRKINQILFIISLIFGKISSPQLLNELNIKARNNEFKIRMRQRDLSNFT